LSRESMTVGSTSSSQLYCNEAPVPRKTVGVGVGVGVGLDAARADDVVVAAGLGAEVHPASPRSASALDATTSPAIPPRMTPPCRLLSILRGSRRFDKSSAITT
jgi:hypothetical protein